MIVSNMYALPAVAFIRTYDPSITITAGNLTAWLRFEREKVATQPSPVFGFAFRIAGWPLEPGYDPIPCPF